MLHIQLFGGLRITLAGKPIDGFYSIKAPALVAYLTVTRRTPTRDLLAALLWGEMPDVEAKTNLRQCLANLRKLLDPFLSITRDTAEFNFDASYSLDVEQFENLLRAENLDQAVELYKGDFLEGVFVRDAPDFEEWAMAQRARLRELALQALHTLVEQRARRGDFKSGIAYATRLLALDPWREETQRELMLLLARTGQRSAALEQYLVCQRVLAEGLGVAPAAETTALYERLRTAGESPRHNLPAPATTFVGRAHELAQVENALRRPACRLVTLHGVGGIGKTRLAIQAAERALQLGSFLNGVYFVPLDSVQAPDLIAPAIAAACGFTFSGRQDPQTQVANFLREKEILLILDNFEHLLAAATWLGQLLKTAPRVKLLVTSRERLNLQWEWIIVVEGLEHPAFKLSNPSENLKPEIFLKWSAVDLFIERARQARLDFQIDETLYPSIARVCQRVAGLPLGIELAAASVATHSIDEIAREIERGYDFLATTQRDAPDRQRSLRAVFDYSWSLLSSQERAVFSRLAIFRGGFTRAAAEQIANASPALLNALVDKSLVRVNAPQRYGLHEIILQYAEEKLGDARAATQIAHARYFADWMQQQAHSLYGAPERQAIAAINADLENVHAAWWSAIAAAHYADIEKFLPGLQRLYDLQSRFVEGEKLFGAAAERLAGAPIVEKILARQASLLADLGQTQRAAEILQRGLAAARRADDAAEIMFGLKNLGNVLRGMGKYAEAKNLYAELLALSQRAGARNDTAAALNNLAVLANTNGDEIEAKRLHQECLALRRDLGDQAGVASSLLNLATVTTNLGEYAESEAALQQALTILREFGDRRRMAAVYTNLGAVAHRTGRSAAAKEFYQHALALHRETGMRMGITIALNNVGSAACDLEEWAEARTYLLQALREAKANQLDFVALDSLVWIAALRQHEGKRESAVELLALVLQHSASDSESKLTARTKLAQCRSQLAPQVAAQAEARGAAMTLEQALDELIA